MARFETVVSPPVLGAGRRYSYAFPVCGTVAPNALPQNSGQNLNQRPWAIENTTVGVNGFTLTTTGAPPAPNGMTLYKNRLAWRITSSAATGRRLVTNFSTNQCLVMPFQNVKGAFNPTGVDDFAVWSVTALLAFDAIPGVITGDVGLVLGTGTRAQIRGAATQFGGIELGPSDVGVLSLFVRQTDGGAVTFNQPIPNPPADLTAFHQYELRMVSATDKSEAQLKVLIDQQPKVTLPWGAGTVLPDQVIGAAGNLGFEPAVINELGSAAGTVGMYVADRGITVCAAPTELALQ